MGYTTITSLKIELAAARAQSADATKWANEAAEYVKAIEAEIARMELAESRHVKAIEAEIAESRQRAVTELAAEFGTDESEWF